MKTGCQCKTGGEIRGCIDCSERSSSSALREMISTLIGNSEWFPWMLVLALFLLWAMEHP